MSRASPPPARPEADRWRAVHLAGDARPPIALSEPERPFWQPDFELKATTTPPQPPRAPITIIAAWLTLIAAGEASWLAVLWVGGWLHG